MKRAGYGDAVVGDRDLAALERLAQQIEHAQVELGKLVEKQHAAVPADRPARRAGRRRFKGRHAGRVDAARGAAVYVGQRRRFRPEARRSRRSSRPRAARPAMSGGRIDGSRAASIDFRAGARQLRPSADCARRRPRPRAHAWRFPGRRIDRPEIQAPEPALVPTFGCGHRRHLRALHHVVGELNEATSGATISISGLAHAFRPARRPDRSSPCRPRTAPIAAEQHDRRDRRDRAVEPELAEHHTSD